MKIDNLERRSNSKRYSQNYSDNICAWSARLHTGCGNNHYDRLLTCLFNRLSEGMVASGFASTQTSSDECFISQLGLYLGQNRDVPPSNNSGKAIDCA